jgi:NTE family protein
MDQPPTYAPKRSSEVHGNKTVNLALQGGGSHGAFTWGVVDRLLEDERIDIEGVSGASAGAVNAVVLVSGLATGGRAGARKALESFWGNVGELGEYGLFRRSPLDRLMGSWSLDMSPAYAWFDLLSRVASPYELNPLNINPLHDLLERSVNWEAVRSCGIKLFVSATNVETGRVRVFSQKRMCPKRVTASTALPLMFQAVEIEGQHYWDGGYMGNPSLWPLFYSTAARDILLVEINPLERKGVPTNARDILNRLNEISFNTALLSELRAVEFVGRLVDQGVIDDGRYRKILVHMVSGGAAMAELGSASKVNAEWEFLLYLKELGRDAAGAWLAAHYDDLGERSSIDLRTMLANS